MQRGNFRVESSRRRKQPPRKPVKECVCSLQAWRARGCRTNNESCRVTSGIATTMAERRGQIDMHDSSRLAGRRRRQRPWRHTCTVPIYPHCRQATSPPRKPSIHRLSPGQSSNHSTRTRVNLTSICGSPLSKTCFGRVADTADRVAVSKWLIFRALT